MTHPPTTGASAARSGGLGGAFVIAMALCAPAFAQVPSPLLGTWNATWQTDKKSYEAVMTVTDTGGSWKTATLDKYNSCAGREVPMKIESSSATEVQFQLRFSDVLTGCPNVGVTLRVGPDGAVTGTRSKYDLTLVKK